MKILLNVKIPHHAFNAAVKDGTAGSKLTQILNTSNQRLYTSLSRMGIAPRY